VSADPAAHAPSAGTLDADRPTRRIARYDAVTLALVALLCAGVLLRAWFVVVWRPAITGFSDSGVFFQGVVSSLWSAPGRTAGYSMFLRVLHAITPHLILVVIVQHALGLATAVLLFLAVRRCGGPRGLGLVPAAVIALGGDQLFLEHSALSEGPFIFLLSAALYCALRASQGSAWWAAAAGLCAGLGVWDRLAGLAIVAVLALWLLFSAGRPTRRTIAVGLLSLAVSLASLGVYVEWRHAASGLSGLTTNGAWDVYGRVAPWADCTRFSPPAGTRRLCESKPPARRGYLSSADYIFNDSPAVALFGPSYFVSRYPHAMALLRRWSQAAILGEPLQYLHAVWLDALRLVDPNRRSYGSYSARQMIAFMLYGPDLHSGRNEFVSYWQKRLYPHDPAPHHGDVAPLESWERLTRIDGPWMVIGLALCLAVPLMAAGPARRGAALFAASALTLLFVPILATGYDYRYVIPAFGPLSAAGALVAWGVLAQVRPRVRSRRAARSLAAP